jgi:hypothetical protein
MSNFNQIQGGETGELSGWDATKRTPKVPEGCLARNDALRRALTVEPTQELIKVAVAQEVRNKRVGAWRVARLFGVLGVELARRERWGYSPCDPAWSRPKIRSNVTYHSFSTPC